MNIVQLSRGQHAVYLSVCNSHFVSVCLQGIVDKSKKIRDNVYMTTFEILAGDNAAEFESPLALAGNELNSTASAIIIKAVQTLRT